MSDDPDVESQPNRDDIDRSKWSKHEVEVEKDVRKLAEIFTDQDKPDSAPAPSAAAGPATAGPADLSPSSGGQEITSAALVALADADARADEAEEGASPGAAVKHRNSRRLAYAIVAAFFILTAAGAIAFLALRSQSGVDATAPTAPPAGGDSAQVRTSAECFVNPADAPTTTAITLQDKGVADPSMFMVQWNTVVTNEGSEPILVTAHRLSSGEYGTPGWEGAYQSLPPGGTTTWSATVDNNAGGTSGPLHWSYVDKVVAVRDDPTCANLLTAPTAATEASAESVALPDLPDGAVLPNNG